MLLTDAELLDLCVFCFKRGEYEFITKWQGKHHKKQEQCLAYLADDSHREITYGGAAGGAKSWTGCAWLIFSCLAYPGTKWFIGREELKRLTESTYITFQKVCKAHGIIRDEHWKYNGQMHYVEFANGSRIDFLDLRYKPSDALYERYGSLEFTGGWIEEAGEVNFGAYDTLKSRIGRHMNDRYGLTPKIFKTCNPKKNWLYRDEYKPFREGTLPDYIVFLQAFVQDNPHIEAGYIDSLRSLKDKAKKERLLFGNWEYDDDPAALMSYDAITDVYTNEHVDQGQTFITADIARLGRDTTEIWAWSGFRRTKRVTLPKSRVTETADEIRKIATELKIPMSRVICDEDGVGGGVVDILKCKGFVNNSKPLKIKGKMHNYANLKSQCAFALGDRVERREYYIPAEPDEQARLTEELEQIKKKDIDKDGKQAIVGKDKVKEMIGRSPDLSDTMLMREFFALKPPSFVI